MENDKTSIKKFGIKFGNEDVRDLPEQDVTVRHDVEMDITRLVTFESKNNFSPWRYGNKCVNNHYQSGGCRSFDPNLQIEIQTKRLS